MLQKVSCIAKVHASSRPLRFPLLGQTTLNIWYRVIYGLRKSKIRFQLFFYFVAFRFQIL